MLDVLVIGAGQAGLATYHALRGAPLRVALVDAADRVGDAWRRRHDSLRLFSPRSASALPGRPMPGDPDGYPTKDEVAEYLDAYARWLGAPVRLRSRVRLLSRRDGRFLAELETGEVVAAHAAVIATGAFQEAIVPAIARGLSPEVTQLTAATYRNPRQLPAGRVLVAGDGATGRQLALELAGTREAWLATGRFRPVVPQRLLGRDQGWWAQRTGLLDATRDGAVGRLLRRLDPFPGTHLRLGRLRRKGVRIAPRLLAAHGRRVAFEDGTTVLVDAVVWAVGWRERTGWVRIPGATDEDGRVVERRGISPVPGLYVVGREWQWTRGSSLLAGVARDAAFVAERLVAHRAAQRGGEADAGGAGLAAAGPHRPP